MQQLQQQRALLDPTAAHHLHLHQQQQPHAGGAGHVHPAQTMTINRKLHGAGGGPTGGLGGLPLPPVYGDDNPPPLPPLRNPQKALPPVSTVAGSETTAGDAVAGSDKQIYIYSTAKYGKYDPNGRTHLQQQAHQQQQPHPAPVQGKHVDGGPEKTSAGGKNPNTTTFSSTPASNSKPLPSIINCPLPDIPKTAGSGPTTVLAKDDIYVKRKLLSDHPNGSKFATLKPIPVPKIEPGHLNGAGKQHPTISNGAVDSGPATPADLASQLPPPPPPPPPVTASSSGSSGGSSGYGTAGLTTSQIQSLPLPPPPLELLQHQQNHHDDQSLRLPPPPTSEELRSSAMEGSGHQNGTGPGGGAQNGDTGASDKGIGGSNAAHGHDDNSFYAVTEL